MHVPQRAHTTTPPPDYGVRRRMDPNLTVLGGVKIKGWTWSKKFLVVSHVLQDDSAGGTVSPKITRTCPAPQVEPLDKPPLGSKYVVKKARENDNMTNLTQFAQEAVNQLRNLLTEMESKEHVPSRPAKEHVSFAVSVLEDVINEENKRKGKEEDDLSEVDASAVPEEVRDWLASTFTRKMGVRRDGEKPKFKSIVNALRAGMFVERMFRRMSGLQGLQYPAALIPHLKGIDEWTVDMFALNEAAGGSALKYVTYELLNRYDLVSKFKIPVTNLINFLDKIEAGYSVHDNPYHNLIHGADITQTCHYFMLQTGLMNWLTDLEIFAVLIAACCHDVEHTGTTNNFHINTQSELALLYNDKSVLENHHVSFLFRVMRENPECNILSSLSRDDFQEFRQLVVDMILATDMSFHFSQLKAMKTAVTQPEPIEKTKALSLILHTADISHPAKQWSVHYRWTMLVIEEFFRQGDREAELGLPYSPLCDRHTLVIPDSQIGFINFIVSPSMDVCSSMLNRIVEPINNPPEPNSEPTATNSAAAQHPWTSLVLQNKETWKQKSQEEAERKRLAQEAERVAQTAIKASGDTTPVAAAAIPTDQESSTPDRGQ